MNEAGPAAATAAAAASSGGPLIKHFRQALLWPVRLMPPDDGAPVQDYLMRVINAGPGNPWQELHDEFTGDPAEFQERHYNEFVAFLPTVQRFLYGQGLGVSVRRNYGESPIRVLRRRDVSQLRVTLTAGGDPIVFAVAHIDLYFFFDVDVAMLAMEIYCDDLPLKVAQETMFQLGRGYPAYWETDGRPGHCPQKVELLSAAGEVLAESDYENREKFLKFVCEHRAPRVARHWEFLMRPLVLDHTDQKGPIRYLQLEYHRMPLMAYLALERPDALTPGDSVRLALASGSGDSDVLPLKESYFDEFKERHCYDVFRDSSDGRDRSNIYFWSCGMTFVMTGDAGNKLFSDAERGYLARFRHQHFILFMIAHFHRAALQMFSDKLAGAVNRLDVGNADDVQAFRRETRGALEAFLRFTHRYWFEEISDQAQTHDLFALCRGHLGVDRLYEAIRQETQDMSQYLENEAMRRQNETVVRLTVVTIFGLIGTFVTGFIGMNIFDWAHQGPEAKLLLFAIVFVPTTVLTFYTVKKSRRLSDFLDALADENLGLRGKWRAFLRIW